MDHIAIDVGGRESQICVRRGDGTIAEERRCATGALKGYLGRRAKGRVILETCAEGFPATRTTTAGSACTYTFPFSQPGQ